MLQAVGLDFGTTNSAIAVASAAQSAQLVTFEADGQATTTFRSILYFFHPRDDNADGRRVVDGTVSCPSMSGLCPVSPMGNAVGNIPSPTATCAAL